MTLKNNERVALLKGGWNSEREISLLSAKGIFPALRSCGFEVIEIEVTRDIQKLIQQLADFKPDVVFLNALHGQYVEDGMIQSLMEMLGYPYTGSDYLSSALAFDKARSRSLFEFNGIRIPKGQTFIATNFFAQDKPKTAYPFVIKPVNEGSSVGVFLINSLEDFKKAAPQWRYGKKVLVEEYISGSDLFVPLMNDKALGILEIRPKEGFYDYETKYTQGLADHIMPAHLSPEDYCCVVSLAEKAVKVLGVSGVSRVDIRFDDNRPKGERAFVLEVNTLPGMTSLSIVPEVAVSAGFDYENLCKWMVKNPVWPQENPLLKGPNQDDEKFLKQAVLS